MTTTTYELSGVVTALSSSIHNVGESLGITSKLRREKFVQPDGSVADVPVISGNGMRGRLRDLGMAHFCRSLGLSMPAFYFLFSGGALTARDGGAKAIDPAYVRKLREAIPLVSVFGGAVGATLLPGKLKVDKLYPICGETSHLLPEAYRTDTPMSVGTRFYWRVLLDDVTDVEFEAFLVCLAEFSRVPYIGGRSAVGLGHISLQLDQWRRIDSRISPAGEAVDVPIGTRYQQHLRERRDEIRQMLEAWRDALSPRDVRAAGGGRAATGEAGGAS